MSGVWTAGSATIPALSSIYNVEDKLQLNLFNGLALEWYDGGMLGRRLPSTAVANCRVFCARCTTCCVALQGVDALPGYTCVCALRLPLPLAHDATQHVPCHQENSLML